ncbi:MAG: Rossmann-like and DUF2520 domain-containing protein [Phocaeicola sp.]
MKIALIGAGNVATHLGSALQGAGHQVIQVYSYTKVSAATLGELLQTTYTTQLEEVTTDADLYILSVKDAVLSELIPQLTKGREQACFAHTAGSLPITLFEGYATKYGVFYPMQTFSKERAVDFQTVSLFIEGNSPAVTTQLKRLASEISPLVYEASSTQRAYLHVAAVFACNFSNHMYNLCASLLEQQQLPFEAMFPLIDETARKVHHLHPQAGQTGPAVRGDWNVVEKHLEMLANQPELQTIYKKLSESIYNKSKQKVSS